MLSEQDLLRRADFKQVWLVATPILGEWKRRVADFFSKDLSAEDIVGEAAKGWRTESRVEGEVAAIHKVLLLQASVRFGEELPDNVTERLNRCGLDELMALARLLATVNSLAEWLKELPE